MAKNETYEEFIEKFKPQKTTDDCPTPPEVYDVVLEYVRKNYPSARTAEIIRPFWPGLDYTTQEYPIGCVVVDNPPFSIMSKILNFFDDRGIYYFLFTNGLTSFSNIKPGRCVIGGRWNMICENGANININFITNLPETAHLLYRNDPEFFQALNALNKNPHPQRIIKLPFNVVTAAGLQKYHSIPFCIEASEATIVKKVNNIKIFGSGLMLSESATKTLRKVDNIYRIEYNAKLVNCMKKEN